MKYFLLNFLLLFSFLANGQEGKQTIKGVVIDQESEIPLIGAYVTVTSSNSVGTATDINGEFLIEGVPVGRQIVEVSYIGYETTVLPNLVLTAGKEMVLEVMLEETSYKMDEVTIYAKTDKDATVNEMTAISARNFSLEEVTRFSGGRNDVSRLVSNYAGVSTANDSRNDIVIRGNSPTGVLWKLEGIDIPNPNHFSTLGTTGGPVSAVNTNLLKTSDFLSSAFPSEYGNALSGVFDLSFRSGNKDTYEATLQLAAFSGLEAMIEGPMGKNKNASFLISYRHSFVQLANSIGMDIGTNATPDYKDLSFNFDFGKTKFGKISLFGILGTSDIEFLASEIDTADIFAEPDADSNAESALGIIGLKHSYIVNDKSYLRTIVSANLAKNKFQVNRYMGDLLSDKILYSSFDDEIKKQNIRSYYNTKLNARNTLRVGVNVERQHVKSDVITRDGNEDLNNDGYPDIEVVRALDDDLFLYQAFAQNKFKLSDKSTFLAGIHAQALSLTEDVYFAPRLGYNYQLNERNKLSFGYGVHAQMLPLPFLLANGVDEFGNQSLINKDLNFTKAQHIVLGWDWKLAKDWRTKIEVYHQYLFDVPVEEESSSFSVLNYGADFGFPIAKKLVNEGTGTNYGIEFTLEKFFSNGFYGLMTGSIYESKYIGSDGIERNTAFNNRFVYNILGGKEFKFNNKAFTVDFKMTNAGGRFYTPVDLEESRRLESQVTLDEEAFSLQYEDYFRIDLKFGMSINSKKRKFSQQFYFDFQNITNRENVFAQRYNRTTNQVNTLYQSGFFPDLLYRVQF